MCEKSTAITNPNIEPAFAPLPACDKKCWRLFQQTGGRHLPACVLSKYESAIDLLDVMRSFIHSGSEIPNSLIASLSEFTGQNNLTLQKVPWVVSCSGFSIKEDVNSSQIVFHYPGHISPLDGDMFSYWLEVAEKICDTHNLILQRANN